MGASTGASSSSPGKIRLEEQETLEGESPAFPWGLGVLSCVAELCHGLCAAASRSPSLLQYVREKPAHYRYEAPSPELCEQIRSVRSVQCPPHVRPCGVRLSLLAPRVPALPPSGSVSPARSLLTLASRLWLRRISKAMLKWACWIITDDGEED